MSREQFPMPEPRAAIRGGDAVLEFTQQGEVVGQFNFSKVIRSWITSINEPKDGRALEVVR